LQIHAGIMPRRGCWHVAAAGHRRRAGRLRRRHGGARHGAARLGALGPIALVCLALASLPLVVADTPPYGGMLQLAVQVLLPLLLGLAAAKGWP
jgi:hypothetical protein